jgi:hypothetical protein
MWRTYEPWVGSVIGIDLGGLISLAVQRVMATKTVDGRRYHVRVTTSGVPWVRGELSWWFADLFWLAWIFRPHKTWTVSVVTSRFGWARDLYLRETHPTRKQARARQYQLASGIADGSVTVVD